MRFKVNLDGGFGEAVSVSASLVKSSSIAPDAVFLSAENDKVKVEGFNYEMQVWFEFDAGVTQPGGATLSASMFGRILQSMRGEVNIEVDNDRAIVFAGKTRFDVVTLKNGEKPELSKHDEDCVLASVCTKELVGALQKVIFVPVTKYTTRYAGVLFEAQVGKLNLVATDGYRLGITSIPCSTLEQQSKGLIPITSCRFIMRILSHTGNNDSVSLCITPKLLAVLGEDFGVYAISLLDDYPAYQDIIPSSHLTAISVSRHWISEVLRRVSIVNDVVEMEVTGEALRFVSQGNDGIAEDEVTCYVQGRTQKIVFSAQKLIDALRVMDAEMVKMYITSALEPIVVEDEGYKYVFMPIRL